MRGLLYRRILVDAGLLAEHEAATALEMADKASKQLLDWVVERGLVAEDDLLRAVAEHLRIPVAQIDVEAIDPEALASIPADLAAYWRVLPLRLEDDALVLATSDPADVTKQDDIRTVSDRSVRVEFATRAAIVAALEQAYAGAAEHEEPEPEPDPA